MYKVGIFSVRVVLPGEKYGVDDCLTHDEGAEALIEFYDATQSPAKFGVRGQFVSRYFASTLQLGTGGLDLYGGVPMWQVSEEQMKRVRAYLQGFAEGRAR